MTPLTVLVTGATGRLGGTVLRQLLRRGHRIRALVRHPEAPAATYLEKLGVRLMPGDLDDPGSLQRGVDGADAVFAISVSCPAGPQAEVRRAEALARAARRAEVSQLLFSSMTGADRTSGAGPDAGKAAIERRLDAFGVPWTVLAPAFFMENFLSAPLLDGIRAGRLALPLPAGRPLQQLALWDLGRFAALVLEQREPFLGRRIEVASDELTGEQAAEQLSWACGREIAFAPLATGPAEGPDGSSAGELAWLCQVPARAGYPADVEGLRRTYPEVGWHRFGEWLKGQDLSICMEPLWLPEWLAEASDSR